MAITEESITHALAAGKLGSLEEPVARTLLDQPEALDQLVSRVDLAGPAAVKLALESLIDCACLRGDERMRSLPEMAQWHTLALSVLLRGDSDHKLFTIADSRALERQIADALGLDYASVRVGPYCLPSLAALRLSASDMARTCAAMRLDVTGFEGAGGEGGYGANIRGAFKTQLALQSMLFLNVRSSSASDVMQMAEELRAWAAAEPLATSLGFLMTDGSFLQTPCTVMSAGMPWTLRSSAAYDIQALVLSELANQWAEQQGLRPDGARFTTVADFDEEGEVWQVHLLVWRAENPDVVRAASLATGPYGSVLDQKVTSLLLHAGWSFEDVPDAVLTTGEVREIAIRGQFVPVQWDARFPREVVS